jgi:hypothetical protein
MVDATTTKDVCQRAQSALATSPIHALRILRVEQEGETLTLSGRVSTFYYKQLAQEIVRSVAVGATVVNHVDVD